MYGLTCINLSNTACKCINININICDQPKAQNKVPNIQRIPCRLSIFSIANLKKQWLSQSQTVKMSS